jgi:hypothetical protein
MNPVRRALEANRRLCALRSIALDRERWRFITNEAFNRACDAAPDDLADPAERDRAFDASLAADRALDAAVAEFLRTIQETR